MRKIDKQLNISKLNLLSEQRYLEEKNGLEEGWKTNMAAGIASLGAGMSAQAQQAPQQQSQGIEKSIQATPSTQNDANVDRSAFFAQTKPIFHIQTGVQDGKTGKSSVYVYHKDPKDPSFDVKKDRETVYTQNLENLQRTQQYQEYMKRMHDKQMQTKQSSVNETNDSEEGNDFNNVYNTMKQSYLNEIVPVLKTFNVDKLVELSKKLMSELNSDYKTVVLALEKIGNEQLN